MTWVVPLCRCSLKFGTVEDLKTHLDKYHCSLLQNTVANNNSVTSASPTVSTSTTAGSWTVNLQDGKGRATRVLQEENSHVEVQKECTDVNQMENQVIYPRKSRRPPQVEVSPSASLNREELQKKFGKYASKILISNESFYYCQVCMFKTNFEEEFHSHFNCDEHSRTVLKLEQPWSQAFPWSESQKLQEEKSKIQLSTDLPVTHWGMDPSRSRPKRKRTKKSTVANEKGPAEVKLKGDQDNYEDFSEEEEEDEEEESDSEESPESGEDDSTSDSPPDLQAIASHAAQSALASIHGLPHPSPPSQGMPVTQPEGTQGESASSCMRCGFMYHSHSEYYRHCSEVHGDKYMLDGFSETHKMLLIKSHVHSK